MILISVIICSYDPRLDYLTKTLKALRVQDFPESQWELIIVDNNSPTPISKQIAVDWHPNAKVIVEPKQGLTFARLAGIRASRGELLIFVDDDNYLKPDYISTARKIAEGFSQIGVFGGSQEGLFESAPSNFANPLVSYLAVRTITREIWVNIKGVYDATPFGAGMCIRRMAALAYAERCSNDLLSQSLDRTGTQLLSGGDLDMAWGVCDLGLGMMVTPRLSLTHAIKTSRLEKAFLLKQVEGSCISAVVLNHIHKIPTAPQSFVRNLYTWLHAGLQNGSSKEIAFVVRKGYKKGHLYLEQLLKQKLNVSP